MQIKNDPLAIKGWLKTLPKDAVIALESTGGYGMALARIAHRSGRTVFMLAPRQVSAYRRALGRRAKNDHLDAGLIRDFVEVNHMHLHAYEPWAEPWRRLRDTVRLRTRLAKDRGRIALRMRAFGKPSREIASATRGLKQYILKLDRQIEEELKDIPEAKAVRSPRGIGPLTTAGTVATLKQIPLKTADAFVAFTGLDLIVSDSGKSKNKRAISSWGDETLRSLFYMAGKTAASLPEWSDYVATLAARGMKPIQIHCAVARRLARIAFALYRSGQTFDPEKICPKKKPAAPSMLAKQA